MSGMMKKQNVLVQHRERLLQLTVLIVALLYIPFLGNLNAALPKAQDIGKQSYMATSEQPVIESLSVFSSRDNAQLWEGLETKRVWLQTKVGLIAASSAELDVPPMTSIIPPMLLPTPGPALNVTHELPRWPNFIKIQDQQ